MKRLVIGAAFTLAFLSIPAVVAAGPILYSVQSNGDDHLYSIDAATLLATDLGLIGFDDAEGLAFVGSTLYAIGGTGDQLWNITAPPGALVGATGARIGTDAGLDYNTANGTMYNINADLAGSGLYTVNLLTGLATLVGSSATFADGLAIDGSGNAYAINGINTDALYSVNLTNGALTLIGSLGFDFQDQFGMTFADGTLYALTDGGQLYTINTANGAATLVGSTICGTAPCSGWEGLAAPTSASAVPEPGTLLLLGSGLVAAAAAARRRIGKRV